MASYINLDDRKSNGIAVLMKGVSTGGSGVTLQDNAKFFEQKSLVGKFVKFSLDGIEYFKKIEDNDNSIISFGNIATPSCAKVVCGPIEGGQVTVVYNTIGSEGNVHFLSLVLAPGDNDNLSVGLLEKTLTVFLGRTNGTIDPAKNTATQVVDVINQIQEFTATMTGSGGPMTPTESPLPFEGGVDEVLIGQGVSYEIIQ